MNSNASYAPGLRSSAVRGGVLMVVFSLIFIPWLTSGNGRHSVFNFVGWFMCLWLFFPLGALLGGSILKRLRGLSLPGVAMAGLGIGVLAGLLLALALLLFWGWGDVIGLMRGGSPGYMMSVSLSLRKLAWHYGTSVVPLAAGIVCMWAIFRKADEAPAPAGELVSGEEPRVRLRLGLRHLAAWGLMVAITAVVTTVLVLLDEPHSRLRQLLPFILGGAGVPVLGPWMGPAINPGDGYGMARTLTCVLAPVLLLAAAPFLLRLRVRLRTATVWWCGFLTALLLWLAAGIISALSAMG
jgi:hypothetical protein